MDTEQAAQNAVLAALPASELEQICAQADVVRPDIHQQVYWPGKAVSEAFFPIEAVFSLVAQTDDEEAQVEVATIGREGMVGLPLFLGSVTSPHMAFCQVPGSAVRMRADALRSALRLSSALHNRLNRFTQATMVQIAQNVVCNSTHSVEQRACRWLLTTHDRVGRDQFALTHQFLAQMLGVRRPTVSETAGRLQERGLIWYQRGLLIIADRAGLEAAACRCYTIVTGEFTALMHENDDSV